MRKTRRTIPAANISSAIGCQHHSTGCYGTSLAARKNVSKAPTVGRLALSVKFENTFGMSGVKRQRIVLGIELGIVTHLSNCICVVVQNFKGLCPLFESRRPLARFSRSRNRNRGRSRNRHRLPGPALTTPMNSNPDIVYVFRFRFLPPHCQNLRACGRTCGGNNPLHCIPMAYNSAACLRNKLSQYPDHTHSIKYSSTIRQRALRPNLG